MSAPIRFFLYLALSFSATAVMYFTACLVLTPAPIAAEYWVREMLVIKKSIARKYAGRPKIVIVAGSGTLFSIDARRLTETLGVPVINFGVHAELPLAFLLNQAESVVEQGNAVLLPLETELYTRNELTAWQVRNLIAWDQAKWRSIPIWKRLQAIRDLKPGPLWEIIEANVQARFFPSSIRKRLESFDDRLILDKWANTPAPTKFEYSAYNVDAMGDMPATKGTYQGKVTRSPEKHIKIPGDVFAILESFVTRMNRKGVLVRFVDTPFIDTGSVDIRKADESARSLSAQLPASAKLLDNRCELLFSKACFLNSEYHMNEEGRKMRTALLAGAIRRDTELTAFLDIKTQESVGSSTVCSGESNRVKTCGSPAEH